MADVERVVSVSFNQDASCIAVATTLGFKIFQLGDDFKLLLSRPVGACSRVSMLFQTSLLALTGPLGALHSGAAARRVVLYDPSTSRNICDLNFPSAVIRVLLNRQRVVVALATRLHIIDVQSMATLDAIETGPNPTGLAALAADSTEVAFPLSGDLAGGAKAAGLVAVVDTDSLNALVIPAHETAIVALALSRNGSILASASSRGTLIRISSTADGSLISTHRRGTTAGLVHAVSVLGDLGAPSVLAAVSQSTLHLFLPNGKHLTTKITRQDPKGSRPPLGDGMSPSLEPTVALIDARTVAVAYDGVAYVYAVDPKEKVMTSVGTRDYPSLVP